MALYGAPWSEEEKAAARRLSSFEEFALLYPHRSRAAWIRKLEHMNRQEGATTAADPLDVAVERQAQHDALRQTTTALRMAREELVRYEEIENLARQFRRENLVIPTWTSATHGKRGKRAIGTLHASDWHLDEVIQNRQILGYNHYDRRIAELRLRALADGTIKVASHYMAGVEWEGLTVLVTGDTFSGDIHEELRVTNEGSLYESCLYWVPKVVAWLRQLADAFGVVHVGAVVGNHGRNTHKPIYKNRPQNNIEWLFWHWIADRLAAMGDERITFQIADGLQDVVQVYNTSYAIEHGDEFRGGAGIVGALSPVMLGQHRSAVQHIAMGMPMDYMVIGHFHQLRLPAAGFAMGGSLKGYDEFAAGKHFRPEAPQQGFWVTSPEHGPTINAPIFVLDRGVEGW